MDSETLYHGFYSREEKAARFAYYLARKWVKTYYKETPYESGHQARLDLTIEELTIKIIDYFFKNGPELIKNPKAFISLIKNKARWICADHTRNNKWIQFESPIKIDHESGEEIDRTDRSSDQPEAEDILIAREYLTAITIEIKSLGPKCERVLSAYYLDYKIKGERQKNLAAELGMTHSEFRAKISRCIKDLNKSPWFCRLKKEWLADYAKKV